MSGRPMNHQRTWASFWLWLDKAVMDHDLAISCGENLKFATATFRFGRGEILQNSAGAFEKSSHGIQNSGGKFKKSLAAEFKIVGWGIQKIFAAEFKIAGTNSKNLHGGIQNSRGELKQISMRVNVSKRGRIPLHVPKIKCIAMSPLVLVMLKKVALLSFRCCERPAVDASLGFRSPREDIPNFCSGLSSRRARDDWGCTE